MTSLIVLPGAGSPYNANYQPVYDLLIQEGQKRNIKTKIFNYVGYGQEPDIGDGLLLSTSADKIKNELLEFTEPYTLLCSSYGCYVGAYFLAYHPELITYCKDIRFMGPISVDNAWKVSNQDAIEQFNKNRLKDGCLYHPQIWNSLEPFESLAKKFHDKPICLFSGENDLYCDSAFLTYLQQII